MKRKLLLLSALIMAFVLFSCKKDKETEPTVTPKPVTYPNYSALKVGNYWIYEKYRLDTLGNETSLQEFDSCYIEKDTLINGHTWYKLMKPDHYNPSAGHIPHFLRDSLHYLINNHGAILFSSEDFSTVFSSSYLIHFDDTIYHVEKKMTDMDVFVHVPAGNFKTSNIKETYTMNDQWSKGGKVRIRNNRYSENTGLIVETLAFFTVDPNYTERRLVRFKVD